MTSSNKQKAVSSTLNIFCLLQSPSISQVFWIIYCTSASSLFSTLHFYVDSFLNLMNHVFLALHFHSFLTSFHLPRIVEQSCSALGIGLWNVAPALIVYPDQSHFGISNKLFHSYTGVFAGVTPFNFLQELLFSHLGQLFGIRGLAFFHPSL